MREGRWEGRGEGEVGGEVGGEGGLMSLFLQIHEVL